MGYAPHSISKSGIPLLKTLLFVGVALLASGINSQAEARSLAFEEVELPSVQGWQITAIRRVGVDSVICAAGKQEKNSKRMRLIADPGNYPGEVWSLSVVSHNHHLKPGVKEAGAQLSLDGKPVATGAALTNTGAWVLFEFPYIDAYLKDIKAARVVEVKAEGLSPLKLESLSPIITAMENCQRESMNPEFWRHAKDIRRRFSLKKGDS